MKTSSLPGLSLLAIVALVIGCGGVGGRRAPAPDPDGGGGATGSQGEGEGEEGEGEEGEGEPGQEGEGEEGEGEEGEGETGQEGEGEEGEGEEGEGEEGEGEEGEGEEGEGEEGEGETIDAGPRPAEELTGVINVTQVYVRTLGLEPYRGNGGAFFAEAGAPPEAAGCQLVEGEDASPTPTAHAGVIRVGGGSQELVLTPTATGDEWTYVSNLPEANTTLFDEGDVLSFQGEGGPHVGPFRQEMDAPARVLIGKPNPPFDQPLRGGDVDVRWNGQDEAAALITITAARGVPIPSDPVDGPIILCSTEDDGEETVSAELMAQLPAGDGFLLGVSRIKVQESDIDEDTDLILTAVIASGMSVGYR